MLVGWFRTERREKGIGRSVGRIGYTIFHVITDIKCQKIFALSFPPFPTYNFAVSPIAFSLPPEFLSTRTLFLLFPSVSVFSDCLPPSFSIRSSFTPSLVRPFSLFLSLDVGSRSFVSFSPPRSRKFSIPFM